MKVFVEVFGITAIALFAIAVIMVLSRKKKKRPSPHKPYVETDYFNQVIRRKHNEYRQSFVNHIPFLQNDFTMKHIAMARLSDLINLATSDAPLTDENIHFGLKRHKESYKNDFLISENVVYGQKDPEKVFKAFRLSDKHRRNMLKKWEFIGISMTAFEDKTPQGHKFENYVCVVVFGKVA